MKLDISYAEFSLLRELVKAKQRSIWKEQFVPALNHTVTDARNAFKMLMSREATCTDRGCYAILLRKFGEMEEEVQTDLGMRR